MMKINSMVSLAVFGFAMALSTTASAVELVTNGGFEVSDNGNGQVDFNTVLTGWSVVGGYTFLFGPDGAATSGTTADNSGAVGQFGTLELWGPGNGSANGLTVSPTGGYFIAQDSAFQQAAITQVISGLTIGKVYNVSFDWAAAQQYGFDGDTFDRWEVSFGAEQHDTATIKLPDHGFSGWMSESFQYTATATSQTLSFFAEGGPPGLPPFALLDNVSVQQAVPEPGTMMALFGGVVGIGSLRRRRRARRS